jgi:ATP-dependent Clp protease protease subunit
MQDIDKLLAQRKVPLTGPIDDQVAQSVLAMMLFLFDRDRHSPIEVIIDSAGGLASSGLAIVDLIREYSPRTRTVAPRYAAGVATVILACGARGHRRMGRNAFVEISPVTSHRETPQMPAEIARIQNELTEILTSCTGRRRDSIREDLLTGRTFDAEAALAYGLVDAVLPD